MSLFTTKLKLKHDQPLEVKTYFTVIHPNATGSRIQNCKTQEEAQEVIDKYNNVPNESEYFQHWEDYRKELQIFKVIEFSERIK